MATGHTSAHARVVVGPDGNVVIPAEGLAALHASAGTELEVEMKVVVPLRRTSVYGLLKDLPPLTWDDFERGSKLAIQDLDAGRSQA